MEQHFKVGIAGCGALGEVHAERFSAIPGVHVVAGFDPSPLNLDNVKRKAGIEFAVYSDFEQFLDEEFDILCIASPDSYHVAQLLAGLETGRHILCEKPLTPDPSELKSVIAAVENSGKRVSLSYPRRYDPGIRRMREEIQSGNWGKIIATTAYNAEDWITPNRGTWRHDPKICPGGFFYDANGHQIDVLFWLTGLGFEWVKCSLDYCGLPVPICASGIAQLSQGVTFVFSFVGSAHIWRERINIHCEKMDFVIENMVGYWSKDGVLSPMVENELIETADEAFIKLLRGEGPNWSPVTDVGPVLNFTRAALDSGMER